MSQHLSDGQLRAALDGELAEAELQHVNTCPTCQARRERIRLQVRPAAERLSFLIASAQMRTPDAGSALEHFIRRKTIQKENSMLKKLFASPILQIGLAIVLILAVVLAVPSTRALADQLLNLFRVQQVVVVPIDYTGIQQLTGNDTFGKQISDLISSSTTVSQKPGEPTTVTDADQASQLAGFTVRLPQGMTPTRISVENAAAFTFKIDRAKAQALLDEAGRSDLVLPDSIDGADVSVNIPASASAGLRNLPRAGRAGQPPGSRQHLRAQISRLRHHGRDPQPDRLRPRRRGRRSAGPDRSGVHRHDRRPGGSLHPIGRLDLLARRPDPQECGHV